MSGWIASSSHHAWLSAETGRLLEFGAAFPHPRGGAAWLGVDGTPDLTQPVHTWITARMAHVYSLAHLLDWKATGGSTAARLADHALDGLRGRLRDAGHGGWFASVDGDRINGRKAAYDHAFVILAAASATHAGRPGARDLLDEALAVFETRFWDEPAGMCLDRWNREWTALDPYRGINANMHAAEAFLAAADATGEDRWRGRALRIATFAIHTCARAHGWRVPEHFTADWRPMPEHNAHRPGDPFQPYGATVGHGLEWSRLLLHLRAALGKTAPDWLLPAARQLFTRALEDGWSGDGFVYTTDWSGRPVVRDRMHWVIAEAIAAAAALHTATGDHAYARWYRTWWEHADSVHIDRKEGSWHDQLDPANRPIATVWPGKPDLYHPVQATLIPRLPLTPSLAAALAAGLLR